MSRDCHLFGEAIDRSRATRENEACVICEERVVTVVAVPCGHAHVCLPCVYEMSREQQRQCITCSQCVQSVMRIRKR